MTQDKVLGRREIALASAIVSILMGLILRANSELWASRAESGNRASRYRRGPDVLVEDIGAVLLALGVLILAALINRWLARAPETPLP